MPDIYCPNCLKTRKVALVLTTADEGGMACPRCHKNYPLDGKEAKASVRTASPFGGGGGSGMPGAPGGSPFGSQSSSGSYGINAKNSDDGIESYISRTQQGVADSDIFNDEKFSMEKRLEDFHAYAEEDAIPYQLSHEERKRLRIKKEVQRREKFYGDAIRSVDQNSVPFIKKHFKDKPEHVTGREDALDSRRRNKETINPLEDESPAQIQPERVHSIYSSTRKATMVNRFSDPFSVNLDEEDTHPTPFQNDQMTEAYEGNMTTVKSQGDLDRNLANENNDNWGGSGAIPAHAPFTGTLGDNYSNNMPEPHGSVHLDENPTSLPDQGVVNDPNIGTQAKLDALKKKKPSKLPGDALPERSWNEQNGNEQSGIHEKYKNQDTSARTPYSPHI